VERGGILWTHMGPAEARPPLPEWEFITVPPAQTFSSKRLQESNWLQAMEGGIDSSHVSFLHRGDLNSDPLFMGTRGNQYNLNDARPVFEVVESDGACISAPQRGRRPDYWRIASGDAVLHDDRAARQPPRPRPLLDPDRRRTADVSFDTTRFAH
jgi:phenylpropionate dioxygenase-like ring-hydroxylating dioxygenase large terminal subunit